MPFKNRAMLNFDPENSIYYIGIILCSFDFEKIMCKLMYTEFIYEGFGRFYLTRK